MEHMKLKKIRNAVNRLLMRFGLRLERVPISKDTPIRLWETDTHFTGILTQLRARTIVDALRCFMIYQYARQTSSLKGDCAEVGVYKGGTARLLAKVFGPVGKTVHLFDTFSGMPPCDSRKDTYKEGDFGDTSFEDVKAFLSDCSNVRMYKGIFPLSPNPVENATFCMVHIDVDIYKSVMDCCKFFYPRMEKSGIMIFDDYGFPLCPGALQAVDEFFSGKPEKPVYLPTGQCVVSKL